MPFFYAHKRGFIKGDTTDVSAVKLNAPYILRFLFPEFLIRVIMIRAVKLRLVAFAVSAENNALGHKKLFAVADAPESAALKKHRVARQKIFGYIGKLHIAADIILFTLYIVYFLRVF